jgi:hypothetical protein
MAILLGCALVWIPSILVLAWLMWRAPVIDQFEQPRTRDYPRLYRS